MQNKKISNIEKICKHARKINHMRGEALLCLEGKSEEKILLFINRPDRISDLPYCIATETFSTGHATPDSYIEIEKMEECQKIRPYKRRDKR